MKMAKYFIKSITGASIALLLISCTPQEIDVVLGTLTFSPSGDITVTSGSTREVLFQLSGSQGIKNQQVNFSVSDASSNTLGVQSASDSSLATVSPRTCTLSSGSDNASSCLLTIYGKQAGNITLVAESAGYETATTTTTVTDEVQWGTISIQGESNGSYTALYPELENPPYPIILTVELLHSSGVTTDDGVLVNLSSGGVLTFTGTPQQCQLTTATPTCQIIGSLPVKQNVSTTLNPVGAGSVHYAGQAIPVNVTGTKQVAYGQVAIHTQNSNGQIFTGMHAPLFVNWTHYNGTGNNSYVVDLRITKPEVLAFYSYPAGNNLNPTTSTTATCTLNAFSNLTGCGFGLKPLAAGSATILATISGDSGADSRPTLTDSTLSLNITSPSTAGRTITFANHTNNTVIVGVTSGSANAYTGPNTVVPGSSSDNPAKHSTPGAQSMCGTSAPANACPIGSTCVQGGANPTTKTSYFCFWDKPSFTGGTNKIPASSSVQLFISSSSGITSGAQQIQWSGNYHVEPCPSGVCPELPTAPGAGPTFAAVTLAEVTYQHNTVDFYDVSIINGANYALAKGPTNSDPPPLDSNAYSCGTAGSTSALAGGWPTNPTGGLPASTWVFTPTSTNIIDSTPVGSEASSFYAVVEPPETIQTCNTNGICGSLGGTCGWNKNQVTTGTFTFASNLRVCGTFVSWATANMIYGWNETNTNESPFALNTTFTVSPAYNTQTSVSVGNLQLCNNNTYSSYTNPVPTNPNSDPAVPVSTALACGGVNWNTFSGGITRPTEDVTTINSNWVDNVLPTLSWLKQACPTCYTYPFDDLSSTFTCETPGSPNEANYTIAIDDI